MSPQGSPAADAPFQAYARGDSAGRQAASAPRAQARRTRTRRRAGAAWAGAALALFAFFARISFGGRVNSDGANSALQAWDLVHGHFLLHGWHIGDATFYFFELPLNGIFALLFGLGDLASHLASAMTYLIVAAVAVGLAVLGSRGPSRAVRAAIVVTVLTAPLLSPSTVRVLLEEPDHIGTSMFILVSFLLIDRLPGRRFTAPLLSVLLAAGQFSDLTVRYVAVPAIVVVSLYRVLATRRLRSADTALAVAALASVPLENLFRALMTGLGAFSMVRPRAKLAAPRLWPQHASVTWLDIRILFGAAGGPGPGLGGAGEVLGIACLAVAVLGLARVAWDLAPGEPGRTAAERRDRPQRRRVHRLGDAPARRLARGRRPAARRGGARGPLRARADQREAGRPARRSRCRPRSRCCPWPRRPPGPRGPPRWRARTPGRPPRR